MAIKLEVGKTYELNNGNIHTCEEMHGDDASAKSSARPRRRPMSDRTDQIKEAITAHWGERCKEHETGCPVCDAWAEFDRQEAERDGWQKAFGTVLSAVPLPDVLKASGSVGDAIEYLKAALAERDALAAQVADLQQAQTYTYIGKDGRPVLARDLEDERDALRDLLEAEKLISAQAHSAGYEAGKRGGRNAALEEAKQAILTRLAEHKAAGARGSGHHEFMAAVEAVDALKDKETDHD